jgi:hypothetical protein
VISALIVIYPSRGSDEVIGGSVHCCEIAHYGAIATAKIIMNIAKDDGTT